jgi:hypothetical protein
MGFGGYWGLVDYSHGSGAQITHPRSRCIRGQCLILILWPASRHIRPKAVEISSVSSTRILCNNWDFAHRRSLDRGTRGKDNGGSGGLPVPDVIKAMGNGLFTEYGGSGRKRWRENRGSNGGFPAPDITIATSGTRLPSILPKEHGAGSRKWKNHYTNRRGTHRSTNMRRQGARGNRLKGGNERGTRSGGGGVIRRRRGRRRGRWTE